MAEKSPQGRCRGHFRQADLLERHKTVSQPYNIANSELWEVLLGRSSREGRKGDRRDEGREARLVLRRCLW